MSKLKPLFKWLSFLIIPLIFYALSFLVDWKLAVETFSEINLVHASFAMFLSLSYPITGAQRWRSIVNCFKKKISFGQSLNSIMIAFSANLFAPAKTGDFIKALVSDVDLDKKTLVSGVISERIIDLSVLCFLAFLGSFIVGNDQYFVLGLIGFSSIYSLIYLVNRYSEKLKSRVQAEAILLILKAGILWKNNIKNILKVFFWSLLNWSIGGVQIWLLFLAFGAEISLLNVVSIYPIAVLVSLIPLTPGGLGIREFAFVFFFLPLTPGHISIMVSLCYYIFTAILIGMLGAFFVYPFINKSLE